MELNLLLIPNAYVLVPLARINSAMCRARVLFRDGTISEAMFCAIARIWIDAHYTEYLTQCDVSFLEVIENEYNRHYSGAVNTLQ